MIADGYGDEHTYSDTDEEDEVSANIVLDVAFEGIEEAEGGGSVEDGLNDSLSDDSWPGEWNEATNENSFSDTVNHYMHSAVSPALLAVALFCHQTANVVHRRVEQTSGRNGGFYTKYRLFYSAILPQHSIPMTFARYHDLFWTI
jgi:hypothetical protein